MAARYLAFALSLLLCACSFESGHTSYHVTPLKKASALEEQASLYIMMPRDFQKDGRQERGTGLLTQQLLQEALNACPGSHVPATFPQDLKEAAASAAQAGCAYLVELDILDWYDPPATLTVSPDRGEVNVSVYNAQSLQVLRSDNVTCSGYPMLINHIGAYSPKDCLKPGFAAWGKAVFAPHER